MTLALEPLQAHNARSFDELLFALNSSQGQFKLLFGHCNYSELRQQVTEKLLANAPAQDDEPRILELQVEPNIPNTASLLPSLLECAMTQPYAVIISGLETAARVRMLLEDLNQRRELLRDRCEFPILFWLDDRLLSLILRRVPDLDSWATIYEFDVAPQQLIEQIDRFCTRVFDRVMTPNPDPFLPRYPLIHDRDRIELQLGLRRLKRSGYHLTPQLRANIQFIVGRRAYERGKLNAAIGYFQQSLDYWTTARPDLTISPINDLQGSEPESEPEHFTAGINETLTSGDLASPIANAFNKTQSQQYIQALSKQGVLWIHLGLCQMPGQHLPDAERQQCLSEAAESLRQGVAAFNTALRPELNAAAMIFLAQVLDELESWRSLPSLLRQAIPLHKQYGSPLYLAIDYLLLAEVAVQEQHWQQVRMWALRAQQLLQPDHLELTSQPEPQSGRRGELHASRPQTTSPPPTSRPPTSRPAIPSLLTQSSKHPPSRKPSSRQIEPSRGWKELKSSEHSSNHSSEHSSNQPESFEPCINSEPLQPLGALLVQLAHLYQALVAQEYQSFAALAHSLAQAQSQLPVILAEGLLVINPAQYLKWLERSRQLYFTLHRYRDALQLKLKYQVLAQQYGFQAFVGIGQLEARHPLHSPNPPDPPHLPHTDRPTHLSSDSELPDTTPSPQSATAELSKLVVSHEIQASGRGRDIQKLVHLFVRPDRKLIAIHGQSGVGKSSLIQAGLVPTLRRTVMSGRVIVPIVLGVYADWPSRLIRKLNQTLSDLGYAAIAGDLQEIETKPWKFDVDRVLKAVEKLTARHLAFVFIFDQFEEFFFANSDPADRINFYYFLDRLLSISFVKAAISVRDDCLHCLLECDRWVSMEVTQHDILNQKSRYYIGNFKRGEARNLIRSLTANYSTLTLDADLIEELVRDLSAELSEVRPIELQIVGVQLQQERITSLEDYRRAGPKDKFVRRFLLETISHCGPENETTAIALMFCLTDKNGTRPIRTRADLAQASKTRPEQLDEILQILCDCGLIFALPDSPAYRYQLVHDYFVPFIRREQERRHSAETEALRQENRQLYEDKELLEQLAEAQDRRRKSEQISRGLLTLGVIVSTLGAIAFGVLATAAQQARQRAETAERQAAIAAIEAQSSAATARWLAHDSLQAIVDGLRASSRLAAFPAASNDPAMQALTHRAIQTLNPIVQTVVERNRLEGHDNSILGVKIAPDGTFLASVSWDESLRVWSRKGLERYHIPRAHHHATTTVTISPDSTTIATGGNDRSVKLWQADDGTQLADLKGHRNIVTSIVFSPDGRWLASADTDGVVIFWDRQRQQELQRFQAHDDWILDLAVSPDGSTLASASRDRRVRLWTLEGELQAEFLGHTQGVTAVDFSPDGRELVTGSADRSAILWSRTGMILTTFQDHQGWVRDTRFSPDGQTIATSDDQYISLWDRDGTQREQFAGHHDRIWSLSFDPTGSTLASASADNTIRLWDTTDQALVRFPDNAITSVAISSVTQTEKPLATASGNQVYLYTATGEPIAQLTGHTADILTVAFNPQGSELVSAAEDGTARIWSLQERRERMTLLHGGMVQAAIFSSDGKTIATAGDDGVVRLWDAQTGARQRTLYGHTDQAMSVAFDPLNELLASASADNTIRIWTRTGSEILTLHGHDSSINWVTFSPDGEHIASASADNTIRIWTRDGNPVVTLMGHTGPVNSVMFAADGQTLASVGDDRTLRLWQVNGKALMSFEVHDDRVLSVAFSPDDQYVFTSSTDRTLRAWSLDLQTLVEQSCRWVKPYLDGNPNVIPHDRQLCDEFVR